MKKFFKITGISLLLIVLVYLVLCLAAPPFFIEKTTVINAKDSTMFLKFADFKKWDTWSPWTQNDPTIPANSKYKGVPYVKGHEVEWVSKKEGNGRQVIVDVKPYSYVKTALYFQPGEDHPAYSEFKLEPVEGGTKVTWNVKGDMPFMFKGFAMLMGMNKKLGEYFSRGLQNIKTQSEIPAPQPAVK